MLNVDNLQQPADHTDSISITREEVYDALVSLDPNKAFGIDLISLDSSDLCAYFVPATTPPIYHVS